MNRLNPLAPRRFAQARKWAARHPETNPFTAQTLRRSKEWCLAAAAEQMRQRDAQPELFQSNQTSTP